MDQTVTTPVLSPVFKTIDGPWIALLVLGLLGLLVSIVSIVALWFLSRRYQQPVSTEVTNEMHNLSTKTTGRRPIPVQIEPQPMTSYETQKMEVFVPQHNDERMNSRYPPYDDVEQMHRYYERASKAYF